VHSQSRGENAARETRLFLTVNYVDGPSDGYSRWLDKLSTSSSVFPFFFPTAASAGRALLGARDALLMATYLGCFLHGPLHDALANNFISRTFKGTQPSNRDCCLSGHGYHRVTKAHGSQSVALNSRRRYLVCLHR